MGGLKLIAKPTVDPVALEAVRAHVRITGGDEDGYLEALVKAVTRAVEQACGVALLEQTWELSLDAAPSVPYLELTPSPLRSVVSIKSYDDADAETVLASTTYQVDTYAQPGRVVLKRGVVWPTDLRMANGLLVQYKVGYGATAEELDADLRHGLLQIIASLYEQRESISEVTSQAVRVMAAELVASYKTMRL